MLVYIFTTRAQGWTQPQELSLIRERKVFPERTDPEGFLTGTVRRHTH